MRLLRTFRSPVIAVFALLVGSASSARAQFATSDPVQRGSPTSLPAADGPPPANMTKLYEPAFTTTRPVRYARFDGNNYKNGNDDGGENGNGEKEPKHIRDNAFLVEEAFNQEQGQAQHILNWVNLWDRTPQGRTRDFTWNYTLELPLGSQAHQFSFTPQVLSAFEKPRGDSATQPGGIGDTFLSYRYQLLADDDFLWCAPRLTLIIPTGDERFGLGTGELGYQFNLPISRYGDRFDYHFNAGFTYTPNVSAFLTPDIVPGGNLPAIARRSPRHDLHGYNLGASVFWKPKTNLNFFVEGLALWNQEIDDRGFRGHTTQVFVNPGVRYAVCQFEEVEWIIGVSAPVGLTKNTPDIGLFVYMSVEHAFRKIGKTGRE